jgi:DNA replication protein DnaC
MKTTTDSTDITTTTDTTALPDPLAGLPPYHTALDEFLARTTDIREIANKQRTDLREPWFFVRTIESLKDAIEEDRLPQLWPHKPDWRFSHEDQLAAVLAAHEAFEKFKTSDPIGIALAARDEEEAQQARRARERLAAQAETKRLKERQARIQIRLEEFESQIGWEMLKEFDTSHPDIDAEAARRFFEHPLHENVILAGGVGMGKTRCMACRATDLIKEGEDVGWISAAEFAGIVSALGDQDSRAASINRLQDLATCEILFLDDLGAANFTEARTSRFFDLIDHRHRHGLPCVLTTNLGLTAMRRTLSPDRLTSDRILRRIVGSTNAPTATTIIFGKKK